MSNALFRTCCADIEAAYQSLGHRLGWRFLSGPKANLNPSNKLAFISLNPGGSYDPPDHPHESQERGSAYLVESWDGCPPGQSKLQVQVNAMFKLLADRMGGGDYRSLMNRSLMGHFIPFRSPNFDSLNNKAESLAFANQLWSKIFNHIAPRTVITMDNHTFDHVRKIIEAGSSRESSEHVQLPTGWGSYMADVVRYGAGGSRLTLVRIPHLSRFTIFTSQKCREAIPGLMDAISK
jgi:hypothetical protein